MSFVTNQDANLEPGVVKLDTAQKALYQKQKNLADVDAEIAVLKAKNRDMKVLLMKALVERDELQARRVAIESNIERLNNQQDNMDRETCDLLKGDEADHVCERFALNEQLALINKIQDNRNKLMKNGFPLHFFA